MARTPDAPDFEPLDESVTADLAGLREALQSSGYDVHVLQDASRAQIGARIFEVAREIPEGGTFVVYFTGHGVRLDADYLLPADAVAPPDGDWDPAYRDSLFPADISRYLGQCRAGTVLWLIDACRDELTGAAFGTKIVQGPPTGGFALMVGCDLGERCGYSENGSFFTRGLIDAMSSLSAPQTVHEVYEATRSFTSRLARRHGMRQRVQIRYGTDQEDRTRATAICEGRHLLEEWRAAVTDDRLWRLASSSDLVLRLQECLLALVEDCARLVQNAGERLRDPWTDDDFAPRLLLRTLPQLVPPDTNLSAVEVAALIAAVFLREAAWAERLSQAAEAEPLIDGRGTGTGAHRRHLEQVHDQYAHVSRRLTDLLLKERYEDQYDVGLWLVHRWIAERLETDEKPVPAALVTAFADAVLTTTSGDDGRTEELADVLARLASGIGSDPPLDRTSENSFRKVLLPEGPQHLRERPLTALLRLAGVLATDVRTLPEVVAEHLGVSDAVLPGDVVAVVRDSIRWSSDRGGLHLDVSCPHQAIHAALEEVADRADRLSAQIRKLAEELPEPEAALLAGIPGRVTASELRPRQQGGQKAYDVPLLRFRLAQTEVRDLLMGRQLYGSPELALRELYQNAMDACRYRAMRWEYLHRTQRQPSEWQGRIKIVQGSDDRGRYVECRDNGVGMGLEQLTNTFTRAGSRFEQSRLFRQEQAAWLRHDPSLRLYPNSRFGIGVFSYFMLADEMTIVTRPVSRDGVPAQEALRVEISSSGSLFRILKHNGAGDNLAEGGTRVRLYLRDDVDLISLSCTTTLENLVAVSEFDLAVRDSSREVEWQAGKLYPLRAHKGRSVQAAVPGVLWWVDGEGAILCDGITTDKNPFGYVANLTGAHAGTLSVNRKELQHYDTEWVAQNWRAGAPALLQWQQLTMDWLWSLEDNSLQVARTLWPELRGKGINIPLTDNRTCDLDATGLLHIDHEVLRTSTHHYAYKPEHHLWPWRSAVLRRPPIRGAEAAPRSLIGYPIPQPGDADACDEEVLKATPRETVFPIQDWTTPVVQAYQLSTTIADVVRSLRRMRIAHPRLAPPPTGFGDLEWTPDTTTSVIARELAGKEARRPTAGRQDLRGLVAASLRLQRTLGYLVEKCERLIPLRLSPLPSVPPHHQDHTCTEDDLAVLYTRHKEGGLAWMPVSHPGDVREVALKLDVRPQVVLERLAQFSWLGWTVPDAHEVEAWMRLTEDAYPVIRKFTDTTQQLDWAATIVLAEKWDITLAEAEEELAELANSMGLAYSPHLGPESDAGDLVPSGVTSTLITNAYESGVLVTQGFDIEELAINIPNRADSEEYPEIVDELRKMGIPVPADISLLISWSDLSMRSRWIFSGVDPNLDGNNFPTEPKASVLIEAAAAMKELLGEVWKVARSEATRFGLSVPPLPKSLVGFRPTYMEVAAVIESDTYDDYQTTPVWKPLSADDLAGYAHRAGLNGRTAYERLAALRPLGAMVPELSIEALDALKNSTPDERDVLALEGSHRVTGPDEPIVALDLVSIAARLGEQVSETWQRFVPYLPLMPEPAVSVFPDVIPFWQDLAILSKHLDGLLPAIEGRVDPAHVAFVAREVGESEEWVWKRLGLYATMFELDLSDTPGEA